jgi:hypothetical protein
MAQQDTCSIEAGDFRTQTQGGWGIDACSGNNPGCYRDAFFDLAFPDGVTLGCEEGNLWTFTSSSAVAAFLPQGGTASVLGADTIDPTGSASVLAGQLLAAKLSMGFDSADGDFGGADFPVTELTLNSGAYEGWTLATVVMLADLAIGGCMPMEGNLSGLVEALTAFNESFVDGDMVSGSWTLPGCGGDGGGGDGGGGDGGGGGGNGGGDGDGGDDCEGENVCVFQIACPVDTLLGCGSDTAAATLGFPEVAIVCCPAGSPIGSSECTTVLPEAVWTWSDSESGQCPVTIMRMFSATISAEGLDTVITCSQAISVVDTTAPAVTCPPDVNLACGDSMAPEFTGVATATDGCGTVVVAYSDFTLTEASGEEGISRFWTATDACGNVASCLQTITVPDATPPILEWSCPSDTTLEFTGDCEAPELLPLFGEPEVVASDGVDPEPWVQVDYTDLTSAECAGEITITRTWEISASDACGNVVSASCAQTIVYVDAESPVFTNVCGLTEGEQIELCCAPDGTTDIPVPCLVLASDNCGVDVTFSESYSSHAPEPGAQQACAAMEPIAFENGLTCEGDTTHVLRLFCFPGTDDQVAYFTAVNLGNIQFLDDATWTLSWSLQALRNPNAGFNLAVTFSDGLDWAGWNARGVPSGFKGECADLGQAQTWMYYLLTEGTLTGTGEYEGSTFNLSHQPESTFYGTQLGEGANQHNAQYGFGSTLTYSGTFVENGVTVASDIHCCGDLHGEIECCMPFTITRTYTATDCAGNATEFSYQVTSDGQPCPEAEGAVAEGTEPLPEGRTGAITLTGMSPNPAGGDVSLRFAVDEDMDVEASLLNLSGQVVQLLGGWSSEAGQEYTIEFHVGDVPAGLYQLRLASSRDQAVQSLLVVH